MEKMSLKEYKKLISKQEGSERKSKYNNIKTEIDGILFDSQKEADRYCELKLALRAGIITNLCRQVRFLLVPGSKKQRPMYYVADFVYTENGQTIVEDVKGMKTQVYINKKKLFISMYPDVVFRET
jgi:hypothetical protein